MSLMRRRYAQMHTKKARGRILDDFCVITGLSRKHSIKVLGAKKGQSRRRGCPSGDTKVGTALWVRLWRLSDMLCSKLLVVAIPELLRNLVIYKDLDPIATVDVSKISAATIDRRLRPYKASIKDLNRRRRSCLEAHRREIPLKIDIWPSEGPDRPEYLEIDTVAHCGGSMVGSFVWTLMSRRTNAR